MEPVKGTQAFKFRGLLLPPPPPPPNLRIDSGLIIVYKGSDIAFCAHAWYEINWGRELKILSTVVAAIRPRLI
jgi:hypothetical protein